jgi:hypothetical protein
LWRSSISRRLKSFYGFIKRKVRRWTGSHWSKIKWCDLKYFKCSSVDLIINLKKGRHIKKQYVLLELTQFAESHDGGTQIPNLKTQESKKRYLEV